MRPHYRDTMRRNTVKPSAAILAGRSAPCIQLPDRDADNGRDHGAIAMAIYAGKRSSARKTS